ncbi:hypothetical protein LTR66_009709 [Elasticomyces elasticus]|nr:hypothetical protein LTR66_009709 [Elasticomyces elasticus]
MPSSSTRSTCKEQHLHQRYRALIACLLHSNMPASVVRNISQRFADTLDTDAKTLLRTVRDDREEWRSATAKLKRCKKSERVASAAEHVMRLQEMLVHYGMGKEPSMWSRWYEKFVEVAEGLEARGL